jgi:hypothetical protein
LATDVDIANRALSRLGARRITAIADTNEAERAVNSAFAIVRDEVLRMHPWRCALTRGVGTAITKTITGISNANPGVVTSAGHGLATGTVIRFSGVVGMSQVNGNRYKVGTPNNANDFTLDDLAGVDVSTLSFGTYISGGTATVVPLFGYTDQYALPADCLRVLDLEDEQPGEHWAIEGRFLLCDRASPVYFTYIRQTTTYADYDPLLVSAFAARLAAELAEELTQSSQKRQLAMMELQSIMAAARAASAREHTPSDPIESEWLTERLT